MIIKLKKTIMKELILNIMKTFLAILVILFFTASSLLFLLFAAELYWAQSQELILGPVTNANSDAWGIATFMAAMSIACSTCYIYFLTKKIKEIWK